VGGGARGAVWQRTVARLSGRPVQAPDAQELVALGAAAQAAACLSGEAPELVARGWDARRGTTLDPPAKRDLDTLERIRATREATLALHEG
jgi:xylulokinase